MKDNKCIYTSAELRSLRLINYEKAISVLKEYGWQCTKSVPESFVEVWTQTQMICQTWVLLDEAPYLDKEIRTGEMVQRFADTHDMTRFEALALMSGVTPWASTSVRVEAIAQ